MIDDTSSIAQSLAATAGQASLLAVKMEAASQRQMADMLARQAEVAQPANVPVSSANPEHLGQSVDTYA